MSFILFVLLPSYDDGRLLGLLMYYPINAKTNCYRSFHLIWEARQLKNAPFYSVALQFWCLGWLMTCGRLVELGAEFLVFRGGVSTLGRSDTASWRGKVCHGQKLSLLLASTSFWPPWPPLLPIWNYPTDHLWLWSFCLAMYEVRGFRGHCWFWCQ